MTTFDEAVTSQDADARIRQLEGEVARLTAMVERLAMPAPARGDEAPDDGGTEVEPTSSRRGMLKLAGAAAAGVVAATVTGVSQAAADDGLVINAGAATTTTNPTRVSFNSTASTVSGFVFQAANPAGYTPGNGSFHPAALAGWSRSNPGGPANGVYGYAERDVVQGAGVVGYRTGGPGWGVRGIAIQDQIGVSGEANTGTGVSGTSGSGTGVEGFSETGTGVEGTGDTLGVSGVANNASGIGVWGIGGTDSFGTLGSGGYGLASILTQKANLWLAPNNDFFGPGPKTPPRQRVDEHRVGEMECVDGDLWFCVAAGTPGTWKRISGPSASGPYVAITPTRVYDSRVAAPSPGVLAAGAFRNLSVKDGRNLDTGAVTVPNVVPAGATAITANVTVVNTAGGGFLAANPFGNLTVSAATVNWSANGQVLNNGVSLTLGGDRQLTVICGGGPGTQTDFVIDVTGYFS